jgi:hypothetical protein
MLPAWMPCLRRKPPWRSPILDLAAANALLELDVDSRARLLAFLRELKVRSSAESDLAWLKHKGPIAAYRFAIAFHAALLARALRRPDSPEFTGLAIHLPPPDAELGPRSTRPAVRNPLLALRSITLLAQAPEAARANLQFLARRIARECADRAKDAWIRRRRDDAVFWRATSVYAGHLSRALGGIRHTEQLAFPMAA